MDQETHHTRHRHHRAIVTIAASPPSELGKYYEDEYQEAEEEEEENLLLLSKPAELFIHAVAIQVELVTSFLLSLSSPLANILFEAQSVPSRLARRGGAALRGLAFGILGALYACAVLLAALALAMLLGMVLVRLWVEEPIAARRPLHFDYTDDHPCAAVSLRRGVNPRARAVPSGHTVKLALVLLMPESDYNSRIGVFQVTAEVISSTGDIIATSSQSCMLRFRSFPVRLMRTFLMGIPLLLGMSTESQKLVLELLRYKESKLKTEVIRVRLKPRAGTSDLPQIYSAELLMNSQLPWRKKMVYNWKWTFFVWVSLYVYIMLIIVLVCCFKQLVFPRHRRHPIEEPVVVKKEHRHSLREDMDISDSLSDSLREWCERRRKRKAHHVRRHAELIQGSASSTSGTREMSEVIEDSGNFAASESSECVS